MNQSFKHFRMFTDSMSDKKVVDSPKFKAIKSKSSIREVAHIRSPERFEDIDLPCVQPEGQLADSVTKGMHGDALFDVSRFNT